MSDLMKREHFSFNPVPAHRKQRGKTLTKCTSTVLSQLGIGNALVQRLNKKMWVDYFLATKIFCSNRTLS